jgi:hypothetical protein
MSTIRTIKNKDFSVICNTFLRDERLSWKAKGILAYLLSKPDDWEVKVTDLIKRSRDGREAVYSAVNELLSMGYMQRTSERLRGKFVGCEYILFETGMPQIADLPVTENPNAEKPDSEKPDSEKPDSASIYKQILSIPNTEYNKILTDQILTAPAKSQSVGQSVSLPVSMPHEQGIQKEVSDLIALCKVSNKSVALVIAAGLKYNSPKYIRMQIEYVNAKNKDARGFRKLLDLSIRNNYGQAYADDKEITAREREAAADKARRANDTSNALKSFQAHFGKEKAVTIALDQNAAETAASETRESKISEFIRNTPQSHIETLKADFLKSANTLIKKKHRKQGFDSLIVKTAFESYINKEVLNEAA